LLDNQSESYQDVSIILKDSGRVYDKLTKDELPKWLQGNVIISCDSEFKSLVDWDAEPEKNKTLIRHLNKKGYFDPEYGIRLLYRKRGSVSYVIHLAIMLGYEDIVLCGIDLNNSKYFFDDKKYTDSDLPIPRADSPRNPDKTHETNDPDVGNLTVEHAVYHLDELVFNKNRDLYVENTDSALYPKIPEYKYGI
jgi:hypothetical protein